MIIKSARYWNINGIAIAVVAVITEDIDWVAYIGATTGVEYETDAIDWTIKFGAKLYNADAHYFFPDIKLPYRN